MNNEELLKEATRNIFKGDGSWKSCCFNEEARKKVSLYYLPCHLRDDLWLADFLKTDPNLENISYEEILNFLSSSYFQNYRHEYELKIVSWQIRFMLSGAGGWLVPEKYDDDFFIFDIDCDLGFREAVILTLTSIGMDQEVIEEGLEINRDKWLNHYIRRAFYNQNNILFTFLDVEECSKEYENAWISLREYEYYQSHQEMVDKYGTKTSSMQISKEEVTKLKEYVLSEYNKRQEYLNKIKEENSTIIKINQNISKPKILERIKKIFRNN